MFTVSHNLVVRHLKVIPNTLIVILPDATKHDSKQGRSIDRYKIDKISANILHCCRKQQQKILHFIPKVTHLPDHDATATLEKYVHKPVYTPYLNHKV
ncbi:hypothetical protein TSUD_306290 [Trifolium subterraneum]|uniref:Uncharacterized protein n=1 Tax=Trifolium subterraneum TaxID=3900 RepID=A0A2Z6LUR8_TRISU|nr:hypothetical protein TSUD_306290 [Trifolium subterraneum]